MRLSTTFVRGFQLKRWYSAELPNSSIDVSMKTADAHLAGAPCARQISTIPAAMATGKVPAWIQPRQVGLISAGFAGEASSSGTFGRTGRASRPP